MWCNFTLTDAAFHEGGPYSEIAAASVRDTDARSARCSPRSSARGVFDDTAFVLVADHGMEETDPAVHAATGTSRCATPASTFRDEGYGFLYLGDDSDRRYSVVPTALPMPKVTAATIAPMTRHAEPGAAGVAAGEDRRGRTDGEQRERSTRRRRRSSARCRSRTGTG